MRAILLLAAVAATLSSQALAQQSDVSQAIRQEGLNNSRVMNFLGGLADGVGPRLMGSPNMKKAYAWSQETFRGLGAANVHLEDIGEFGLSWRQQIAWLRMSEPDPAVFLAQAAPWSMSTNGPKEAEAVAVELASEADFDRYRGHLRGKIVLLGPARALAPTTEPLTKHWTDEEVLGGQASAPQRAYHARRAQQRLSPSNAAEDFAVRKRDFLASEGVLAVVTLTGDMPTRSGTTGLILDERQSFGPKGWTVETRIPFPVMVTSPESFGRAWRLASTGVPVKLQLDIDTEVLSEHETGYDVVAEIPGSDAKLKSEVVILGAHLDSWAAATGATDNGAGVAAVLETLRILKAIDAKPRRTVRFILYAGEEEGLLGSAGYVAKHFGYSTTGQPLSGDFVPKSELKTLPEHRKVSAVYNIDSGSGRLRGVFDGGDPKVGAIFNDWIAPLRDLGVIKVINERSYFSDQAPFQSVGIPGISLLQDQLDYFSRTHHTNLDTLEHIVPAELAQVATVVTIFVLKTADRDELMPRTALPD